MIAVVISETLFRDTKTNYRLKTDVVNYGILSRQGGEKQYIPVLLQRLVALLRLCVFVLWFKKHFLYATVLLFLYISLL